MAKPKRSKPGMVEQLRQAVRDSGQSLNQLCIASGLDRGGMSRFMRGQQGISGQAIEKLCEALRLQIILRKEDE
jgi:transcriptional regulator with XRE-family HTH domain